MEQLVIYPNQVARTDWKELKFKISGTDIKASFLFYKESNYVNVRLVSKNGFWIKIYNGQAMKKKMNEIGVGCETYLSNHLKLYNQYDGVYDPNRVTIKTSHDIITLSAKVEEGKKFNSKIEIVQFTSVENPELHWLLIERQFVHKLLEYKESRSYLIELNYSESCERKINKIDIHLPKNTKYIIDFYNKTEPKKE